VQALDPGDPDRRRMRDAAIELCLPAAQRLARRYGGTGEAANDVAQVAALGLVKAVDGFDATRGVEFGSYATPTVTGEIKRHFRDRTSGIRMPRRLQELRLAVNKAREDLTQRLGRSPTIADLAVHLDAAEDDIIEMLGASNARHPLSLEAPASRDEQDATLLDIVGDEDPAFGLIDYQQSLHVLLEQLPERERQILTLRFYGNLTQIEIAERVGLSQMHVSRLLGKSLNFLRRRLAD
jgi:RNA polymerase sigma-B factor